MQTTERVDLVFPRSGQVVSVGVPTDLFDATTQTNTWLLSFLYKQCAVVPSEEMIRLHS